MKAILTGGYISDIGQRKGMGEDGLNFIPRPIVPYEFLKKIYEILHNTASL